MPPSRSSSNAPYWSPHPNQARKLFHYRHRSDPFVPDVITPVRKVAGFLFDNGASGADHPQFYHHNSFHWEPLQLSAITGASPFDWTWPVGSLSHALGKLNTADFQKARLQHWRLGNDDISAPRCCQPGGSLRPTAPGCPTCMPGSIWRPRATGKAMGSAI